MQRNFAHHTRIRSFALIFGTLVMLLSIGFSIGTFAQSGTDTTFTPSVIPISADEIGNPGRGLHRWNGVEFVPAPMHDNYRRRHWSQVETAPGVYDFSKYDSEAQIAEKNGMRVILGLPQPTGPSSNGGSWVPADLTSDRLGVWNRGSYHPNFNEPKVLNRWKALIDAIAQRYANDDRVSGLQLCIVGAYGEWYFDSSVPAWARPSDATAQEMIDYIIAKFPNKQLYMLMSGSMPQATIYALQRSPRIGWARMALGHPGFERTLQSHYANNANWWSIVSERWKTAPIITETYGNGDSNQFGTIIDQVQRYHVSLIGNGNFDGSLNPVSKWSKQQISDFQLAGKLSGYRYVLQSLKLSPLAPGSTFTATSAWTNVGLAPVYEPWKIQVQLRNASDAVVFDSTSGLDLRTLLPAENKPTTQADTWTLPANVAPGKYRVHVIIPPLNKYVPALQLAIKGQQGDGSYYLGDVTVATGATAPTPQPSASPTAAPPTIPQPGTGQQSLTFTAEADTRISSTNQNTNYGTSSMLRVDGGKDSEVRSYLRFNVRDLPGSVISATLRVYASSGTANGPTVYGSTSDWSEKELTWNNRPHRNTDAVDSVKVVKSRSWVTYNVTSLVTGNGTVSFVLAGTATDGANFDSRENSHSPQLVVTAQK